MTSLGLGFFPSQLKDPYLYFDRQKFLTLGNGDPLYEGEDKLIEEEERFLYSEFLSIFQTLIFYTEQSESNLVIMVTRKRREYTYLLAELFPDYDFYFFSSEYDELDENNLHLKHHLVREDFLDLTPIIFCENITETNYMDMKPYLVMGIFNIPEEGKYEFYDGIILRSIYGSEIRLIIKGISYRIWDRKIMKKTFLYHQLVVRKNYRFFDPVSGERDGVCKYDQIAEKYLKTQYLKKVNMSTDSIDDLDNIISDYFK